MALSGCEEHKWISRQQFCMMCDCFKIKIKKKVELLHLSVIKYGIMFAEIRSL